MTEVNGNGVRLVVGGNRGIGLALVAAQLADPAVRQVIATHRPGADTRGLEPLGAHHGGRLRRTELDVTDERSVAAFEPFLRSIEGGVDLAIHAAGLLHDGSLQPEKTVQDCRPSELMRLFEVNAVGPLCVAATLLRVLGRRRQVTFAALSAMVGSIGDNRLGGWYGYRASKAALNQFMRTLAIECRVNFPRATIVAIHPGTTDTALSRPFQRNVNPDKLYSPAQTAARILKVAAGAAGARNGCFLNWDGSEIPW
jgi:NAD(P)-dependent dehydrogenase (short-subunit alcohol dehydrogenase family)